MTNSFDLDRLFASAEELEKVAEDQVSEVPVDDLTKIAEDLGAAGHIMASFFVESVLDKLAGSGVPAAGGGSTNVPDSPRSKWEAISAEIGNRHGRKMSPGDNTSVRAEDGGPNRGTKGGALSGARGIVNPAKALS